jgi:hypothetical protein
MLGLDVSSKCQLGLSLGRNVGVGHVANRHHGACQSGFEVRLHVRDKSHWNNVFCPPFPRRTVTYSSTRTGLAFTGLIKGLKGPRTSLACVTVWGMMKGLTLEVRWSLKSGENLGIAQGQRSVM